MINRNVRHGVTGRVWRVIWKLLGVEREIGIVKTPGMMWIGFSLPKAGTLVGLCGVLSNATEDSRLLRLHGMSADKLAATFR
jgi:hypothetical protein